jgi:hypothetical protein
MESKSHWSSLMRVASHACLRLQASFVWLEEQVAVVKTAISAVVYRVPL